MTQPFIIYGLPRSRTSWLSMFLSYRDWSCHHERAMHMRSLADVQELFSTPRTGTVETGAPHGRCLLKWLVPNIKEVVILRPVEEVINSLMNIEGVAFDEKKLRKVISYSDRCLKKIAKDPDVLVIQYDELDKEETCARIFEFCLPYKFDEEARVWWESYKDLNIKLNFPLLVLYRKAHKDAMDSFKRLCKRELLRLVRMGEIPFNRSGV